MILLIHYEEYINAICVCLYPPFCQCVMHSAFKLNGEREWWECEPFFSFFFFDSFSLFNCSVVQFPEHFVFIHLVLLNYVGILLNSIYPWIIWFRLGFVVIFFFYFFIFIFVGSVFKPYHFVSYYIE